MWNGDSYKKRRNLFFPPHILIVGERKLKTAKHTKDFSAEASSKASAMNGRKVIRNDGINFNYEFLNNLWSGLKWQRIRHDDGILYLVCSGQTVIRVPPDLTNTDTVYLVA